MDLLGLEEYLNRLAKANGVQWYGEVLRRNNDNVLRRTLDFEVVGKKGCGQPKMRSRRQIEYNRLKKTMQITERSATLLSVNLRGA